MSDEREMEVGRYNQDKKQYLNCVCVDRVRARGKTFYISAAGWSNMIPPSAPPCTQFKWRHLSITGVVFLFASYFYILYFSVIFFVLL